MKSSFRGDTVYLFSALHLVCGALFFIALFTPNWATLDHSSYGVFFKEYEHHYSQFHCTSDVSQLNCTYLSACKLSSVMTFLTGVLSVFVVIFYWNSPLKTFYSMCFNIAELAFGIMCISIYSAFCDGYLSNNDDVNMEGAHFQGTYSYQFGFYCWMIGVIICGISLAMNINVVFFKNLKNNV